MLPLYFTEFEMVPVKRALSHHSLGLKTVENELDQPLDQNQFAHCHFSKQNPTNSLQRDSFDILTLQKSDINQNKGITLCSKVTIPITNMQ